MADNQIVLSFVGKDGGVITVTKNVASAIDNVGKSAKSAKKSVEDLGEGWKKLSQQGGARLAASDWANKLAAAASGASVAVKQSADIQSRAAKQAADSVTAANKRMELSFRSMLPHIRTTGAALGVYFSVRAVANIIKNADAYQDMSSRLKLVSGSTQELVTAQAALFRIAQQNRTPLEETVKLYYRMATGMRDLGKTQADTLRVVDLVGKAMRISGASSTETAAGLQQFSQALQAGVLNGDEFRSVMENMPRVTKALTDALGVNIATLREMSSQGKLTAETVVNALMKSGKSIEDDFKRIPVTVSGAWTQLSNAVLKYLGDADQAGGASKALAETISDLANNVDDLIDPLAKFFTTWVNGWKNIIDSIRQVQRLTGDVDATKKLYDVNQAISREEFNARRNSTTNPIFQGFGVTQGAASETYFQKVKNEALEAALAAKKLSDEQKEIARTVFDQANKTGISAAWALAMAEVESTFTQVKKSGEMLTSDAGAVGVMQLMSGTANRFKVEAKDTKDNIKGGLEYMKTLYTLFDKNMVLATAAYNSGEGNVLKYGKTVPPFEETRGHVQKVTEAFKYYSDALGVVNSEMENAEQNAKRLEADQKLLNSAQKDAIATAEAQANLETESNKTRIDAINNRIRAIQQEAKTQVDAQRSYDERAKVQAEADAAILSQIQQATEIGKQQIAVEEQLIRVRISALQQELNGTNEFLTQAEIKRDIKDLETELANKAQERARLEQDAAQKAQDAGRASLDMKLKEKEFIDKINADLQFQTQLYAKLQSALAAGATSEQLKLIKDQATASRMLPENVSLSEISALQQKVDKIEELKNKTEELTDTEKKVREEQLRMNQAWDQALQRMEDYAKVWEKVLGTTSDGFSDIAVSLGKYEKQLRQIERDKKEALSSKYLTQAEKENAASQAQYETLASTFAMVADVTDGMKNMFEEGTAGYQQLEAMSKVAALASQAYSIALAVEAVMNQLAKGDVYSAIPRAIAVAAMAMSFLSNIGKTLNGGGTQYSAEDVRKQQEAEFDASTKTMLGSDEVSTSIKDSLELLSRNSSADLDYTKGMAQSLQRVADALDSVGAAVAQVFKIDTASLNLGSKNTANLSGIRGDFGLDPITNMIFGSTKVTRELVGQGIDVVQQALQTIIDGAFVKGRTFVDVLVTKKTTALFGLIGSTTQRIETTYGKMGDPIVRALTTVFRGIYDTLQDSAKLLGVGGTEFTNQLKDLRIKIGRIPLGADGKKNAEKIAAAISAQADRWAEALYPQMKAFQQLGEGMYKTVVRVSEGTARATGELATLGMEAINYADIVNKEGDVAAEIVRQTLVAQGGLSAGLRQYVNEITGSSEDIIDAYKKLVSATAMMNAAGFTGDNLDKTIINAAGGLDAFSASMTTFLEKFMSEGAKLSSDTVQLVEQFGRLGITLPASKDAFKNLLDGIDLTTEGGKKLFGQLIALVPAFSDLQDQIDSIIGKYADILNPFTAISDRIKTVASDFKGLTDASLEQIRSTGPESQRIAKLRNQRGTAADLEKELLAKREADEAEITRLQDKINAEMAKPLRKRNKKSLKEWNAQIIALRVDIEHNVNTALEGVKANLTDLDTQIAEAVASNDAALADKLTAERQRILQQQGAVLVATIEDIWNSLLGGVRNLQKQLASQIATLQGPTAVAALAGQNVNSAWGAITSYTNMVQAGSPRNVNLEIQLIQDAQSAVMERYNAELALIQQAAQEQSQALQEGLQAQIEAINATTQARIEAKTKENEEVLKGLQTQLDAANKLKVALKQIQDYAKSMVLGANSPLSPEARLQAAQSQYLDLLNKAQSGDVEAMGQLTSTSDAYLQAAKEFYGSGTQYSNIFDGVQAAMQSLSAMDAPNPDSIQAHIDALRDAQQAELEQIRKAAQDQIAVLQRDVAQQIKDLGDANRNTAILALKESTISELQKLQELSAKTQEEANRQALEALEIAKREYEFNRQQTEYLYQIAQQLGIMGLSIPSFASGGLANAGLALVGEKGPELVNFDRPGQVLTAEETRQALTGDQETKSTLAAMLVEMKALVTTQSAANPQMVEKLSNMEARLSKIERNSRLIPA